MPDEDDLNRTGQDQSITQMALETPATRFFKLQPALDCCDREAISFLNDPIESPQSNGMAEAFVRKIKRDYARVSLCPDAQTVMHQAVTVDHPLQRGSPAQGSRISFTP